MSSYLIHYGTKNSGRYPRGSGENPNQRDGMKKAAKTALVIGGVLAVTYGMNKMVKNTFHTKELANSIIEKNKNHPIKIKKTKPMKDIAKELAVTKKDIKNIGSGYSKGLGVLEKIMPLAADIDLYKKG